MSLRTTNRLDDDQAGSGKKDGVEEEEGLETALTEATTLQWGDRQTAGQTGGGDRASFRSDGSLGHAASLTESERELKRVGGAGEKGEGLVTRLEEEQQEELLENQLPEKAAQVFSPVVKVIPGPPGPPSPLSPRENKGFWELESEGGRFLPSAPAQEHHQQGYQQHGYQQGYQYDWREEQPPTSCGGGCPGRDVLKHGVSLLTSAMLFPFLVWGGFVFLPFDAPLLSSTPLRLVYTLRCSVFAAAPVILGWLVLGFCRLRYGAVRPLMEEPYKAAAQQAVAVHRHYVSDSTSLFLLYFLQLAVMALYLSQEQLKLIPLLTIVFALGRLVYWTAAAFGSSVRAFGFGLSFLPSVVMMVANFYFIFTVEAAGSIFSQSHGSEPLAPPPGKQRFWG